MQAVNSELAQQHKQMSSLSLELSHVKQMQQRGMELLEKMSAQDRTAAEAREPLQEPKSLEKPRVEPGIIARKRLAQESEDRQDAEVVNKLLHLCGDPSIDYVKLKAKSPSRKSCSRACACQCHKIVHLRTAGILGSVLGSLFLGYSGSPTRKIECSEWKCRNNTPFRLRFTYYFVSSSRKVHAILRSDLNIAEMVSTSAGIIVASFGLWSGEPYRLTACIQCCSFRRRGTVCSNIWGSGYNDSFARTSTCIAV